MGVKLNNYIDSLRFHKQVLDKAEADFRRELKSIMTLTQQQANKLVVDVDEDLLKVFLYAKTENKIISIVNIFMKEAGYEDLPNDVVNWICELDLSTEVLTIYNTNYLSMLDALSKKLDEEENELIKEQEFLIKKSKNFFFKLLHPIYKITLNDYKHYLENVKELRTLIDSELDFYEINKIEKIIKTFKDEYKANFGITVNIRKGDMEDE